MSKIRGVEGMVNTGESVLNIDPILIGGKNCDGNMEVIPCCTKTPSENSPAVFVAPRPISVFRDSFSDTISNGINSNWDIISLGSGQTISQTGGNLVMVSGVNPNEEIIIRTKMSWEDAFVLRYLLTNSSFQANAKTTFEMVDIIGDNLSVTSIGTSVSITKLNHGFTSLNVGQSVFIGALENLVGGVIIPGQWAITSITDTNTFVVSSTGSTGTVTSGTCSVWGWNSLRVTYGSTTTSNALLNSTRKGWNSAADSVVTTSTITSGSMGMWQMNDGIFSYNNTTSNSTSIASSRGGRNTATPGNDTELFLQIRLTVGTSAPTSLTSTIGMIAVEDTVGMQVEFANRGGASVNSSIPVNVTSITSVTSNTTTPSTTANGITTFGLINSSATTNLTSQKSSGGVVTSITLFNNGTTPAYFKLYNKASAPTLASDTPIHIFGIPIGGSVIFQPPFQLRMGTGIAYAIVGGAANTDATAVAVNQVVGGIAYV